MPRPAFSKRTLNSTNFSQFDPGVASSPLNEEQHILKKNELEQHLQEHNCFILKVAEECKAELLKYCHDSFKDFDEAIEDCLSSGNLDFPATLETLKEARMMFKKAKRDGFIESRSKTAHVLPSSGDNDESDSESDVTAIKNGAVNENKKQLECVPSDSDKKKEKKTETTSCEEESDTIFKKPTGVMRRTCQSSRKISKDYQTPKRTGYNRGYNIAKVTPGPDIDRPLSVLRRPVPGELAVSMNGSPLVTTHDNISVPQMIIPLSNGRTVTFIANDGLDPDESISSEIGPEMQERLTVFSKIIERMNKKKNKFN